VVAINALCGVDFACALEGLAASESSGLATSALYFGQQCRVPVKSVEVLHRRGRWWGLAHTAKGPKALLEEAEDRLLKSDYNIL
jgi:hypothetical protein